MFSLPTSTSSGIQIVVVGLVLGVQFSLIRTGNVFFYGTTGRVVPLVGKKKNGANF
jgi:hypothetical protein